MPAAACAGPFAAQVQAQSQAAASVAQAPCFGAPARDRARPCADPALRLTVFPTPRNALLDAGAPCQALGRESLLYPCFFGARRPPPVESIALVGDSHAAHWRGAVDVVASARGWPGISLTRTHCPFIQAVAMLPANERATCLRWNREVIAWLRGHPEMRTLFVSHRASTEVFARSGRSRYETQVAGHLARWRSLPATVRDIVVLRDTPLGSRATSRCVERAIARRLRAGVLCARSRARALRPDPAVAAARRLRSRRIHVVDLTRYFCDRTRCPAVVGGALVHKDGDHITATFARTLGRPLLRAVDDLLGGGADGSLDGLLPDERNWAACVLSEREAALQAGGWEAAGPDSYPRAAGCRTELEARLAELAELGIDGEDNRAHRHAIIVRVLSPRPAAADPRT